MGDGCQSFIVIDVENLGEEAMVVATSGPRLLLLDTGLTPERRIQLMTYVMGKYAA